MTVREITSVALKVFAACVLFYVLLLLPSLFGYFSYIDFQSIFGIDIDPRFIIFAFLGIIVLSYIIIFIFIWKLSNSILKGFEKSDKDMGEVKTDLSFCQIEVLAFRLLGLYFVISHLPILSDSFIKYRIARASIDELYKPEMTFFIGNLIVVMAAAFIAVKPESFIKGFNKIIKW